MDDEPVEPLPRQRGRDGLVRHGSRKLQDGQQAGPDADADVGHVEDGPPLHVDEVDDVAAEQAAEPARTTRSSRLPERAADDQAGRDRRQPPGHRTTPARQHDHRTSPSRLMSPPRPSPTEKAVPELNARLQLQRADELDGPVGERVERPRLGGLVEDDHDGGRRPRPTRQRGPSGPPDGPWLRSRPGSDLSG